MSEPSKWAMEAAGKLQDGFPDYPIWDRSKIIQSSIDSATTELSATLDAYHVERQQLRTILGVQGMGDDCESLLNAAKRVMAENARLKDLAKSIHGTAAIDLIDKLNARIDNQKAVVEDRGNQINQLTADRDQWKAKAEAMGRLLEHLEHHTWFHGTRRGGCKDDCPACARDKLREEMK